MTAFVIKEGPQAFRTTCRRCGCLFEYKLADVNWNWGFGAGGVIFIPCPSTACSGPEDQRGWGPHKVTP